MKISFLVCTHNEGSGYLLPLFTQIGEYCKSSGDEFVILDDVSTEATTVESINYARENQNAKVVSHNLYDGNEYHFGRHKTYGSRSCTGDWIFLIDGDEYISPDLLENIREILLSNDGIDLIRVPRLNHVDGMTQDDVVKWGWRVFEYSGKKYINFPDYQNRIYKNSQRIYWKNRLHEVIDGAKVISELPLAPELSLIHNKTIDRQKEQNEFYNKNFTVRENSGHGN